MSSSLGQPLGVREDETAAFVPFVTAALFGDALSVAEKTFITSGYRGMPSSSLIPLEQHRTLRIEYTLITDILAQLYYSGSAEKDESFAEFTAALLSRSRIPESGRARALRKINAIFMYGTTQAFAAAKQTNISWPLDWPALYLILADKRHEITDAFAKAISEDEAKAAIKGLGQTLRPFNLATAQMALCEGRTCTYYINGSRTA